MLRTVAEYHNTLKTLEGTKAFIKQMKNNLDRLGLSDAQIERAVQPTLCFYDQLLEEVEECEQKWK